MNPEKEHPSLDYGMNKAPPRYEVFDNKKKPADMEEYRKDLRKEYVESTFGGGNSHESETSFSFPFGEVNILSHPGKTLVDLTVEEGKEIEFLKMYARTGDKYTLKEITEKK